MPFDSQATVLLHNPRCSKSRAVKSLLDGAGIGYVERHYLEDPLDAVELAELRVLLGRPANEWVRTKEQAYAALGLDAGSGDAAHFAAIAQEPGLLERPIVVHGGNARVGRPPENVMQLFSRNNASAGE